MTPEQQRLALRSQLDQRCRACGAGSAVSSYCYACGSRDLEYAAHRDQTGAAYLCGGRNRNGIDPRTGTAAVIARTAGTPPSRVRSHPTPEGLGL